MGRVFWIAIALIGIVLLLLVTNNDAGSTFGIANDSTSRAWPILAYGALLSGLRYWVREFRSAISLRNLADMDRYYSRPRRPDTNIAMNCRMLAIVLPRA